MKLTQKIKVTLIAIAFFFTSCTSGVYYSKKQSEEISRGVYATKSSLEVSRVDLALKYSDEVARLVVPPVNPIVVTPLVRKAQKADGQTVAERVVVLPEQSSPDVVKVNSQEFDSLMKDKETLSKYVEGEKTWQKYSNEVTAKIQQDAANGLKKDALIQQQQEKITSLKKYRNLVWGVTGFVGLSALLALLWKLLNIGSKLAL